MREIRGAERRVDYRAPKTQLFPNTKFGRYDMLIHLGEDGQNFHVSI